MMPRCVRSATISRIVLSGKPVRCCKLPHRPGQGRGEPPRLFVGKEDGKDLPEGFRLSETEPGGIGL